MAPETTASAYPTVGFSEPYFVQAVEKAFTLYALQAATAVVILTLSIVLVVPFGIRLSH